MKKLTRFLAIVMMLALVFTLCSANAFAADKKVVKLAFTDPPTLTVGDMTIYHHSYAAMLAFKGAFEKSTGGE